LGRQGLESTEQEKLQPTATTMLVFDELRAVGVQFALGDVGSAYSNLDLIAAIHPHISRSPLASVGPLFVPRLATWSRA